MKDNSKIEKIIAPVEGMTCASCVARVEKSLKKVQGVKNVSVNLATEKAMIEFEPEEIDFEKLSKSVEDAGYKINIPARKSSTAAAYSNKSDDYYSEAKKDLRRDFILAIVLSIPVVFLNMGLMWNDFSKMLYLEPDDVNKILFLLTTPIIFISGKRFFKAAFNNLTHFAADMNSLVAVGTGSAYIYSTAIILFPKLFSSTSHPSHVYFDTVAVIITLILMGRWLEAKAKSKTSLAIKKLSSLKPEQVLIKRNNEEKVVPVSELKVGDTVIIKPGSRIPADGIVLNGSSIINESMITGESIPVEKNKGSKVIGGTVNKSGYIEFEVTATGENSLLGKIIKMVEEAQGSKAPIQNLADKVASVFVPAVLAAAMLTFTFWIAAGTSFNTALINFVAVLIIACPCALGLATPTAIIVGTGKAAQLGILIKNAESLEKAHQISTIIFDKTGTLTKGKPNLTSVITNGIDKSYLLQLAASLEKKSEHPFGEAVVEAALKQKLQLLDCELILNSVGKGILGKINELKIAIGNKSFMNDLSIPINEWLKKWHEKSDEGSTIIYAAINGEVKGLLNFEDEIWDHSAEAVEKLKSMGLKLVMLTGDSFAAAKVIAKKIGINLFEAEILPSGKAEVVKKYQSTNKIVAMVGDGINDSPALAQSDVGIAIGSGTDIAIESSSIVIIRNNLNALITAIKLSKKTIKTIKQNLFWAFFYNVICIPLAAAGMLNPMLAALAMSLSSVSVISNSLRIRNFKEEV